MLYGRLEIKRHPKIEKGNKNSLQLTHYEEDVDWIVKNRL